MKKINTTVIALLITIFSIAQQYNFKNFDKLQLNSINGSVDIELGKDFKIDVQGLPKNDSLITIKILKENCLAITLKKGLSWDELKKINLKIKITMPEISKLYNNSNADVVVNNFNGRYFGIENNGNGNTTIRGKVVDELAIANNGNGNTNAKQIEAKKVSAIKNGNGDVLIKTNDNFEASLSGNGDIVNYGTGKAIILKQSGNGQVIYRN
jgi:hypothetical protein